MLYRYKTLRPRWEKLIAVLPLYSFTVAIAPSIFSRNKYLHEQWSLLLSTFRDEILLYYQLAVIPVERS